MGVMCIVWRSRLAVSIILVLVVCDAYAADGAQPIGKVYPRGNHWAVGHLMGKKSTDDEGRSEEPGGDMERFLEQYYADPVSLRVLEALVKGRTERRSAQRSAQPTDDVQQIYRLWTTARQWEESRKRERQLQQAEQLLSQALSINDESS